MRRLPNLMLLPAVALVVVLSGSAAVAGPAVAAPAVVATQAHLPEDFAGATPGDPNATENAFAPEQYEPNFLWGASVGLSVLTVAGVGLLGLLYWAMVVRPGQQESAA